LFAAAAAGAGYRLDQAECCVLAFGHLITSCFPCREPHAARSAGEGDGHIQFAFGRPDLPCASS